MINRRRGSRCSSFRSNRAKNAGRISVARETFGFGGAERPEIATAAAFLPRVDGRRCSLDPLSRIFIYRITRVDAVEASLATAFALHRTNALSIPLETTERRECTDQGSEIEMHANCRHFSNGNRQSDFHYDFFNTIIDDANFRLDEGARNLGTDAREI